MPLINYKVELKLRWTNFCVLSAAGADNTNANPNNMSFTVKDTKLYVPAITLSVKTVKASLQRTWKISVLEWIYKKCENKNTTNGQRYFLESNFVGANRLFILTYTNQDDTAERYKYSMYRKIMKNYNVIINGKNFYDQPIDSDTKQYKEIRKLILLLTFLSTWRLYYWMLVRLWLH